MVSKKTIIYSKHVTCTKCNGNGAAPASKDITDKTCGEMGVCSVRPDLLSMQQACPDYHGSAIKIQTACHPKGQNYSRDIQWS
jgi:molecular chaperone DnaJ